MELSTVFVLLFAIFFSAESFADQKSDCQQYADQAVAQQNENLNFRCGFTGSEWSIDNARHFNWCNSLSSGSYETALRAGNKFRADALARCSNQTKTLSTSAASALSVTCQKDMERVEKLYQLLDQDFWVDHFMDKELPYLQSRFQKIMNYYKQGKIRKSDVKWGDTVESELEVFNSDITATLAPDNNSFDICFKIKNRNVFSSDYRADLHKTVLYVPLDKDLWIEYDSPGYEIAKRIYQSPNDKAIFCQNVPFNEENLNSGTIQKATITEFKNPYTLEQFKVAAFLASSKSASCLVAMTDEKILDELKRFLNTKNELAMVCKNANLTLPRGKKEILEISGRIQKLEEPLSEEDVIKLGEQYEKKRLLNLTKAKSKIEKVRKKFNELTIELKRIYLNDLTGVQRLNLDVFSREYLNEVARLQPEILENRLTKDQLEDLKKRQVTIYELLKNSLWNSSFVQFQCTMSASPSYGDKESVQKYDLSGSKDQYWLDLEVGKTPKPKCFGDRKLKNISYIWTRFDDEVVTLFGCASDDSVGYYFCNSLDLNTGEIYAESLEEALEHPYTLENSLVTNDQLKNAFDIIINDEKEQDPAVRAEQRILSREDYVNIEKNKIFQKRTEDIARLKQEIENIGKEQEQFKKDFPLCGTFY